jgi:hypothetical protein
VQAALRTRAQAIMTALPSPAAVSDCQSAVARVSELFFPIAPFFFLPPQAVVAAPVPPAAVPAPAAGKTAVAGGYWHPISSYAWDQDMSSVTLLLTNLAGVGELPADQITVPRRWLGGQTHRGPALTGPPAARAYTRPWWPTARG